MRTRLAVPLGVRMLLLLGLGLAAASLALWVAVGPAATFREASAATPAQSAAATGSEVSFRVFPPIVRIPDERMRDHGVWFLGSGLEPDQPIRISIAWGLDGLESRVTAVLYGARDLVRDSGELPAANAAGAFAWGLDAGFDPREGEDFIFYGRFDPVTVSLWDDVTGELLGTTPLVVCGGDREQPWCDAAEDLLPLGDPNGPAGYLSPE